MLVLGLYGPNAATGVVSDPVFQNLRVAQESRAVLLPDMSETNGRCRSGRCSSPPVALREMAPRLAAALDGDPATAVPAA